MYGLDKLNKVIQMDEEQKEFNEQQKLHPKNPFDNGGRVGAEVSDDFGDKIAEVKKAYWDGTLKGRISMWFEMLIWRIKNGKQ